MKNTIAGHALAPTVAILATLVILLAGGSLPAADVPSAETQQHDIARLIAELGSDEFVIRRRSERALIRLGFKAFDALEQAENDRDVEIAARAAYLLQRIEVEWVRDEDSLKVRGELSRYAEASDEDRRKTIARLAVLGDEGLEALCRIARFEPSKILSKRAALEVVRPKPPWKERSPGYAEVVRQAIGQSQRPAVKWLAVYMRSLEDPHSTLEGWDRVIAEEQVTTDRLSEPDQDEIMVRLLYTVAQIHSTESRDERAEQLALRAFEVRRQELYLHYIISRTLDLWGLTDWAEREYRHVMSLQPEGIVYSGSVGLLAQMLHDRQRSREASEVLEAAIKTGRGADSPIRRAQMEYYLSQHFAKANDLAMQREHLNRAIGHDSTNADVLIAMYRLPGADEEYRRKTLAMIKKTGLKMERDIKQVEQVIDQAERTITREQSRGAAVAYNQWAWLIANTEGDRDKAIEYSRKSVDLTRKLSDAQDYLPGYLDTLGHCYFAKGDYENAVKHQQEAVDIEPYTQAINRPLARFKQALAESKPEGT